MIAMRMRGKAPEGTDPGAGRQLAFGLALCTLLVAGCSAVPTSPGRAAANDPVAAAYVVLGPEGAVVARAVITAGACPPVRVDGVEQPMAVRAAATPPAFPVTVCETTLPTLARQAVVAGRALPLPRPEGPRRIVSFGDSGCRIKHGHPPQRCNDPAAWPFASVMRAAAAWGPDLVVNVGDYLYREEPCPAGAAGCAGSPVGENWATWQADFFQAAAPLLAAAPWVVARGDHELCHRGGPGFFRFLDPRPMAASCPRTSAPYVVRAGDLALTVIDSSSGATANADDDAAWARQFAALPVVPQQQGARWLLTHMPLWALRPSGSGAAQKVTEFTPALQRASRNALPGYGLVLSGHIHHFQSLSFADGRPPQLVLGTGGTDLDPAVEGVLDGKPLAGTTIRRGVSASSFGFTTVERGSRDGEWAVVLRDARGAPAINCALAKSDLTCRR